MPLLVKWISRGHFSVEEQACETAITLKVEMFTFSLLGEQTDELTLLSHLRQIQSERNDIARDQHLFNYFVLARGRAASIDMSRVVESPICLYSQRQCKFMGGHLCFAHEVNQSSATGSVIVNGPGCAFQTLQLHSV